MSKNGSNSDNSGGPINVNIELKSNASPYEGSVDINDINFNIRNPSASTNNKLYSVNEKNANANSVKNIGNHNGHQTTNRVLDEKENNPENADLAPEVCEKERVIFISRNKRIAIFVLIISINIACNLEHGTIPACTDELKAKLGITEDMVGLLGTLMYCGNLIGKY